MAQHHTEMATLVEYGRDAEPQDTHNAADGQHQCQQHAHHAEAQTTGVLEEIANGIEQISGHACHQEGDEHRTQIAEASVGGEEHGNKYKPSRKAVESNRFHNDVSF